MGLGAEAYYRRPGNVRKVELSAGADPVRVGDAWIGGEEFAPSIAAAQVLLRQFPERIAGFYADRVGCGGRAGGSDWAHRRNNLGRCRTNR